MATNAQPTSQKEMKLLNGRFQQLLAKVAENRPTDDLEIIRKAYDFSLKHHQGQTRASGEPYLIHPLEVSLVLADMKLDSTAITARIRFGSSWVSSPTRQASWTSRLTGSGATR